MKRVLILSAGLVLLTGCGKKDAQPAASSTAPAATGTAADAGEADRAATIQRLTQTLRKYAAENQRVPKNFEEMVAAGYLAEIPAAPSGKKYVFNDKLQVSLVDAK